MSTVHQKPPKKQKKHKKRKAGALLLPKNDTKLPVAPTKSPTSGPAAAPAPYKISLADDDSDSDSGPPAPPSSLAQALSSSLTPLQLAAKAKLAGSRFRSLNEVLYTTPSAEAFKRFQADPTLFENYHAGFREQTLGWSDKVRGGERGFEERQGTKR